MAKLVIADKRSNSRIGFGQPMEWEGTNGQSGQGSLKNRPLVRFRDANRLKASGFRYWECAGNPAPY